jgi:Na+-driven multidrug efflux pump
MFSIVSIGSITLQFAVNNLGPITVAAHTTARKIDETMMVVFAPLSMASATFASQNLGAGKTNRIKRGIFTAFALGCAISLLTILVTFLYGEEMVRRISGSSNPEVISQGVRYLKWNLPFYFFLVGLVILRSTLQSIGVKITPLIASFVEMIGKASIAFFLVPKTGYFGIIISEPIIWFTCSAIVGVSFIYELSKMKKSASKELLWKHSYHKPVLAKLKQRA